MVLKIPLFSNPFSMISSFLLEKSEMRMPSLASYHAEALQLKLKGQSSHYLNLVLALKLFYFNGIPTRKACELS